MSETVTPAMIDDYVVDAAWAICSTYHTLLKCSPGQAIFGRDMIFDIPYIVDWSEIGRRRQDLVDKNNKRENKSKVPFDYQPGNQVMVRKDGILHKAEDKYVGPYIITHVHTNGTVRIHCGSVLERLNIRRITPYYSSNSNTPSE